MKSNETITDKPTTYEQVFQTSVESIMVVQKGAVILANPRCERLLGYDKGELIGQTVEAFVPQKYREMHVDRRTKYMNAPSARAMGQGRDLFALRKDGSSFPVEISLSPTEVDGEKSVIIHLIDITSRKAIEDELKKSEEQLIQYAAELEERVEERTRELAHAVNELQSANKNLQNEVAIRIKAENEARKALEKEKELHELKTRFVSMASHEFRTPLSTILSSISLVARYDGPETEDKRNKHIARIKSNVAELTSILNDFLSLDKLEAGKMSVNIQHIDVCEVIEEALAELESLLKNGQRLNLKNEIVECKMMGDAQIIKQSLTNLVSNAIKYSDSKSEINIVVRPVSDGLKIDVIDQGIGIPESDQKHLFEKFFRAHNSGHIQGTGLGLNIVQKYLELINGTISFQSEEGKGSTFTIMLRK